MHSCVDVSGLIADVVTLLHAPLASIRFNVASSGAASHLCVTHTMLSDNPNLPIISVAGGSKEQMRTEEAIERQIHAARINRLCSNDVYVLQHVASILAVL